MEIKEIINKIEGKTKEIKTYFEIDNKIYCLILNMNKDNIITEELKFIKEE
jgi:hypothetical protein